MSEMEAQQCKDQTRVSLLDPRWDGLRNATKPETHSVTKCYSSHGRVAVLTEDVELQAQLGFNGMEVKQCNG